MLIAAHGNSLRALVKYLDEMTDADIMALNIPTGAFAFVPLHVWCLPISPNPISPNPRVRVGVGVGVRIRVRVRVTSCVTSLSTSVSNNFVHVRRIGIRRKGAEPHVYVAQIILLFILLHCLNAAGWSVEIRPLLGPNV